MNRFPINKILDTVGDGTGIKNAVGNYSVNPQAFKLVVPSRENYTLSNMIIHIAGLGAFSHTGYGNITEGLANGWSIKIAKDGELKDFYEGVLIKNNQDIEGISGNIHHPAFDGAGNSISITISFDHYGMPFYIREGEYIEILLNDNFSSLTKHQFLIQGHSDKI